MHLTREEKRDKVIKRCLECIEEDGYVRLGYVIEKEMNYNEPYAFYKSVSALLIKDGKYIREPHRNESKDFDVLPNPNYELSKSVKETNDFQKKLGRNSLILAIVSGIFILGTLLLQYFDKTGEELRAMRKVMEQTQGVLRQIQEQNEKQFETFINSKNDSTQLIKDK